MKLIISVIIETKKKKKKNLDRRKNDRNRRGLQELTAGGVVGHAEDGDAISALDVEDVSVL